MIEFQSAIDARMALRNLEYTALLYRELQQRGEIGAPGDWPPVLPIVLYNGSAPWRGALEMRDLIGKVPAALAPYQPAQRSLLLDERRVRVDSLPSGNLMRAVAGFEQSRTPEDVGRVVGALAALLDKEADADLLQVFDAWFGEVASRVRRSSDDADTVEGLKEDPMGLLERAR